MTKKQLLIGALVAIFCINSKNTASLDQKTIKGTVCTFNDNGLLTKISNMTVTRKMLYLTCRHLNVVYKAFTPQGIKLIKQARSFGLKDIDGNSINGAANYAHWIGHYLNINRLLRDNDLNHKVVTGCAQSHYLLQDGYDLIKSITSNGIKCTVLTSHDDSTLAQLKSLNWKKLPIDTSTSIYPTPILNPKTEGYFVYGFMNQFNLGATKVVHIETSESRITYALQAQSALREKGFDVVVIKYNNEPETIESIKRELGIV
jgi:hypothetical protein